VEINVRGFPRYFFLQPVNIGNIERGVRITDAVKDANIAMSQIYSIPLINYKNKPRNRTIFTQLNSCLDQREQQKPPAPAPAPAELPAPAPAPV